MVFCRVQSYSQYLRIRNTSAALLHESEGHQALMRCGGSSGFCDVCCRFCCPLLVIQQKEHHFHMVLFQIAPEEWLEMGMGIMGRHNLIAQSTSMRRFRATFGQSPEICSIVWDKIEEARQSMPQGAKAIHLLWAMMFFKLYCCEEVHASLAGCDEKTFRKWCWLFVSAIANLEGTVVSSCSF